VLTIIGVYAVIAWVTYGIWSVKLWFQRQENIRLWEEYGTPEYLALAQTHRQDQWGWIAEQFCFWLTAPLWFWLVVLLIVAGMGSPC